MSVPSPRSQEIANVFARFARTGDRSEIENISLEELELALIQYHRDKDNAHYIGMERRIEELKDADKLHLERKEKWKERGIGSLIGILVTVIGGLILYFISLERGQ